MYIWNRFTPQYNILFWCESNHHISYLLNSDYFSSVTLPISIEHAMDLLSCVCPGLHKAVASTLLFLSMAATSNLTCQSLFHHVSNLIYFPLYAQKNTTSHTQFFFKEIPRNLSKTHQTRGPELLRETFLCAVNSDV